MGTVNSLGPHRMYVGTINLLLVRSTDAKELAVFYPLFYILFTLLCMSSCLQYLVGRSLAVCIIELV